jgi:acetyltransferase-like isoleucine patch superfamily enzyme
LRKCYLLLCGAKIGEKTRIDMNVIIQDPYKLKIGNHTHINRQCTMDSRGHITIGNNVSISQRVGIITGSHNLDSSDFDYLKRPVVVEDYAWIGFGAIILGGATIHEGAVVCAGAVVTKDVDPYTVVAGVPAKKIRERARGLRYIPLGEEYNWPMFT